MVLLSHASRYDGYEEKLLADAVVLKALLNYFVDLCLLRAGPQDLPSSPQLLWLTFLSNVLVGFLLVGGARQDLGLALAESLSETLLMLFCLGSGLLLAGRRARFRQAATALLGSGTLLGLVALPLLGTSGGGGQAADGFAVWVWLGLIVWSLLVLGHILRHTFTLALGQGVAIGVLYTGVSYFLMSQLYAGG